MVLDRGTQDRCRVGWVVSRPKRNTPRAPLSKHVNERTGKVDNLPDA